MDEGYLDVTRHGKTRDNGLEILNRPDDHLIAEGIAQASELAHRLMNIKRSYDLVYVSPMPRAQDTAQIIIAEMGIPGFETIEDLRERDFKALEGLPYSEIPNLNAEILRTPGGINYFISGFGAETFPDLKARAQRVLDKILGQDTRKRKLIVAHGDIGKMLYAAYYDLDWREVLLKFHFKNTDVVVLSRNFNPNDVYLFKES